MTSGRYVLTDADEPTPGPEDVNEWAAIWDIQRKAGRFRVAETTIGKIWVSTVFLFVDHQFDKGAPLLYETMVFCQDIKHAMDEHTERYATRENALAGHERIVAELEREPQP